MNYIIFLQKFNLIVKFFVVSEYRSVCLDSVVLLYFIFKVWVSDFQGPREIQQVITSVQQANLPDE